MQKFNNTDELSAYIGKFVMLAKSKGSLKTARNLAAAILTCEPEMKGKGVMMALVMSYLITETLPTTEQINKICDHLSASDVIS